MVIVTNLSVTLQKKRVLSGVSCSLVPGRITLFIGKSGAGKTTLLKTLVGLIPKEEGQILIDGKDLKQLSGRQRSELIGYVFQDFNLFPHISVLRNCIDPLLVHGMPYSQACERAVAVLAQLDMESYGERYPSELSGGQQQRVAIARALCLNPRTLLLDEPTASLDPLNTDILVSILKKLAAQGLTIALSSQDMNFVQKIFDFVYFMKDGCLVESCDGKEAINDSLQIAHFIG